MVLAGVILMALASSAFIWGLDMLDHWLRGRR
jgi:hypothetical protein